MPINRHFRTPGDKLNPAIYWNRFIYKKRQKKASATLSKLYKTWGRETVVIISQVYGGERLMNGGVKFGSNQGPYVVGMYHGSFQEALRSRDIKRLKKTFKNTDRMLVLNEADAKMARKEGFTNSGYIHNPVSVMPPSKLPHKEKTIVSLGRYDVEKSLSYLIKAWGEIARDYPDWKLELYGGGKEEQELKRLIKTLGIEDNTFLMGKTNQVNKVLETASIHAMSSQHEGLPIAIVEAARFNVPTVSFASSPGIAELIDDEKTGVITPLNDSSKLAEGLRRLIEDPKLRKQMGVAAHKKSMSYEPRAILKNWEKIFDELEL